ncbi:MAG: hypothetical protein AABW48_01725 [Nanoarchaeota archaeon]
MGDLNQFSDKSVLDQKIKEASSNSAVAPQQFLEAELRRVLNAALIRFPGIAFSDHNLTIYKQNLEKEYLCYFAPETFLPELNKRRTSWWQRVYAGCNAEIEYFLFENKLGEALEKLGFGEKIKPVKQIPKSELTEPIRNYLQGIGYLFPAGEDLLVHPNMLYAQLSPNHGKDSPFLTRDLIRCPYHACNDNYDYDHWQLNDEELWDYWKDLVCLAFTDFPEHKLYSPKDFHGEKDEITQHCLDLGRKLIPSRYLELQPKIEAFEWIDG